MSGITWEVAQLLNDSAAQIRALKASNEALREALQRGIDAVTLVVAHAPDDTAMPVGSGEEIIAFMRDARAALAEARNASGASSLTSNAQPPSLSAVSSEPK